MKIREQDIPAHVLTYEWLGYEDACEEAMDWFWDHSIKGERVITRAFLSEVADARYAWFMWLIERVLGNEWWWWYTDVDLTDSIISFRIRQRDVIDYMMISLYGEIDPFNEEN